MRRLAGAAALPLLLPAAAWPPPAVCVCELLLWLLLQGEVAGWRMRSRAARKSHERQLPSMARASAATRALHACTLPSPAVWHQRPAEAAAVAPHQERRVRKAAKRECAHPAWVQERRPWSAAAARACAASRWPR